MLSLSVVLTSLPFAVVANAANEISIPDKTVEGDRYDPEFSYDENYYNRIIDSVKDVKTIGKLPSYDEFVETTGYVSSKNLSLTEFRETYGSDEEFGTLEAGMPSASEIILIKTPEEFMMLAALISDINFDYQFNYPTAAEQAYYTSANYKLACDINVDCERFYPIGTAANPFMGTFDGSGFEISNLKISGDSQDTYDPAKFIYFGIFGSVGNTGVIKNLGLDNIQIDLPYVVGADVGVLTGRNYGSIQNCYIKGKLNTKIVVSNATVGGIAAENYGTIENTYADFYADVKQTQGSYSDPQPITPVNNGTVTNSYYITWEDRTNTNEPMANDDGTQNYLVGWKSASYNGFNGTGVSLDNLVSNGLPGTSFSKAVVEDVSAYKLYNGIQLESFVEQVGTGADFNLTKAQSILSDPYNIIALQQTSYDGNSTWNLLADLVNKEADNETDAEQQFYANARYIIGGYDYVYSGYWTEHRKGYDYFTLSAASYDPRKTIGTQEHPFNGLIEGNDCEVRCQYYYNGDIGFDSLFGYLGSNAEIRNMPVTLDATTIIPDTSDASSIICHTNNGYIHDCSISGYLPVNGVDLPTQLMRGEDFYSFAAVNNGSIKNCDSVGYFVYYPNHEEFVFGIQAVGQNTGTVENLSVYTKDLSFNNIGTSVDSTEPQYYTYTSNNGLVKETKPASVIKTYPFMKLIKPSMNSDGKYMIYSAADLDYFIRYGAGEQLILMNTIDMCDYTYNGSCKGYFDIDGTLSDQNDLCSYIDLGTGTKCYGILNLSIEGKGLSSGFSKGYGSWRNIYFIGGSFDIDKSDEKNTDEFERELFAENPMYYDNNVGVQDTTLHCTSYILGSYIYNVHYNLDFTFEYLNLSIDGFVNGTYYSPKYYVVLAKNARLCTSGGKFSSDDSRVKCCLIADYATECDSYISFVASGGYYSSGYEAYAIGNTVRYSKTHANGLGQNCRGMGRDVSYCVYDSNLTYYMRYVFGDVVDHCVFRGNIVSPESQYGNTLFGRYLSGFVFDTDGVYTGPFEGMVGTHILFKGTINAKGYQNSNNFGTIVHRDTVCVFGNYGDSNYAYYPEYENKFARNVVNIGTINVISGNYPLYVYGMGKCVFGKMNGIINLPDSGDGSKINVYYYGGGEGANYSDLNYNNSSIKIKHLGVFYNTFCECENYGNVNVSGAVEELYIADTTNNFINYGDTELSGAIDKFAVISAGQSISVSEYYTTAYLTEAKNYGNVSAVISSDCDFSVIKYSNSDLDFLYYCPADTVYNTGKIDISANDDTAYNLKALGSCYINFGDMYIHDITLKGNCKISHATVFPIGRLILEDVEFDSTCSCTVKSLDYSKKSKGYYMAVPGEDGRFVGIFYYNESDYDYDKTITNKNRLYGDISVSDCSGEGTVTVSHGKMTVHDNDINCVHINNIPYEADFTSVQVRDNVFNDLNVKSNGQSDISVFDSSIESLTVDMGRVDNVNFGDLSVTNITDVKKIDVNPSDMAEEKGIYSVVNTGNILIEDISSVENASLSVNGTTFGSSSTCSTLNTGNINIKFAGDIKVQGIGGRNDGMILNSINTGDIYVEQLDSSHKTYVGAISCSRLKRAAGIINWGNIQVSGIQAVNEHMINNINDVKNIVTATVDVNEEIYDVINYGDISLNLVNTNDVSSMYEYMGFFTTSQYVWPSAVIRENREPTGNHSFQAAYCLNFGTFNSNLGNSFMRGASGVNYSLIEENGMVSRFNAHCSNIVDLNQDSVNSRTSTMQSDTIFANCDFSDILKPQFCFRFNNLFESRYINTEDKEQYNGINCFEYADVDELSGQTQAYIQEHYPDDIGSYTVCGVVYKQVSGVGASVDDMNISPIRGTFGALVESFINISSDNGSKIVSTKWGNKTLKQLLSSDLKQRRLNTWVEIGNNDADDSLDIIHTVKKYSSVSGGAAEQVKSKTSLVYKQEPYICQDGKYSKNTIVTIIDIYTPTLDYNIPDNSDIKYEVGTVPMTDHSSFKVFKNPIVAENAADLDDKIKEFLKTEDTDGLSEAFSNDKTFKLHYEASEDYTAYAIIGIAVAQDGRRTNLLAVRLNNRSALPSADINDMSYPTGITSDGKSLIYTKFDDDFYDKSYETVDAGDFGNITYPVYTMKTDMYHYTDGKYTSGKAKAISEADNNKVSVSLTFNNAKGYQLIRGESYDDGDCGLKHELFDSNIIHLSDDGMTMRVVKNDINLSVFKKAMYGSSKYWDDLSSMHEDMRIFSSGGKNTLTVYGIPYASESDNDRVVLCKIKINREKSPENYLKIAGGFSRYDILHDNGVTTKTSNFKFGLPFFKESLTFTYDDSKANDFKSTLSFLKEGTVSGYYRTVEYSPKISYSNFIEPEDHMTYYPSTMTEMYSIEAENGNVADYRYVKNLLYTPEVLPLMNLNAYSGQVSGNTYVMDDGSRISFDAEYSNYNVDRANRIPNFRQIQIYDSHGDYVTTISPDYNGKTKWANIEFYMNYINLIRVNTSNLNFNVFTDDYYTFVPVADLDKASGYYVEMEPFRIFKTKMSESRAVSIKWDNTIVTSAISTQQDELSGDVDIFSDGVIDYSRTPDEANVFYVNNSVEPNESDDRICIQLPDLASLQRKIDGEWTTVFTASDGDVYYYDDISYDGIDLNTGYAYDFRIIAQDFDENDDVKKTHVTYYNTLITAIVRNKIIDIEFDENDATTKALYDDIIAAKGNLSVQIKNMNDGYAELQQTRIYTGDIGSEAAFYKLSQGDYAIDVQVPAGYKAKIKIFGGSSEGYLLSHPDSKGCRVRLPYANAQNIILKIYLEAEDTVSYWGVSQFASSYCKIRNNRV